MLRHSTSPAVATVMLAETLQVQCLNPYPGTQQLARWLWILLTCKTLAVTKHHKEYLSKINEFCKVAKVLKQ